MRASLNRQLHGLASEIVGREEAHDYLHDLAVKLLEMRGPGDGEMGGLGDLNDNEARMLIARLQTERTKVNQVLRNAVALTETEGQGDGGTGRLGDEAAEFAYKMKDDSPAGRITKRQMDYIKELQGLLGWHDRYMEKLIRVRYDENYLDTMPAWKANRLIKMMQARWHSKKQKSEVRSQKSEVRSRKSEVGSQKSEIKSQKSKERRNDHASNA